MNIGKTIKKIVRPDVIPLVLPKKAPKKDEPIPVDWPVKVSDPVELPVKK